jgi:hypothetical protein
MSDGLTPRPPCPADPNIRNPAETFLKQAEERELVRMGPQLFRTWSAFHLLTCSSPLCPRRLQSQLVLHLSYELANESKDIGGRQLAGLYLKNTISAKVRGA